MPSFRLLTSPTHTFPVFKAITTIGKSPGNDVVVDNAEPFHAQLAFDGRDFIVSKVDGLIYVNDKKKAKSKIFHNDRVRLEGAGELQFSLFDKPEILTESHSEELSAGLEGMVKLSDFSRKLIAITDVETQLEMLLDFSIELTRARRGFIVFFENGQPHIAAARNIDRDALPKDVTQLSDSIIQKAIETQSPLIVSDAVNDTLFKSSMSVMNLKLSSVLCVPLIAQGQLLGVLYLGNEGVQGVFEQSSLEIISVFASHGALLLHNALLLDALRVDRDRIADALKSEHAILGECAALARVLDMAKKVAQTDVTVLIGGETGTGKELFAKEIHRLSARKDKPFVVLNCGAIPENLMESELFGYVKGAFTGASDTRGGKFQAADGGTLFLDEIGELPLSLQVKLLRALQERTVTKVGGTQPEKVDIRVLAATNRDLLEEVKEGNFREDLYYRLNVVAIDLPPLRERGDDKILLARMFLQRFAQENDSSVKGFTPAALEAIQKYNWPGNIRQLENRIKKAVVMADRALIGEIELDLPQNIVQETLPLNEAREAFVRQYVLDALERNGNNRTQAAKQLGVDPRTVFRYLERETET